jgi:hypothetical protein
VEGLNSGVKGLTSFIFGVGVLPGTGELNPFASFNYSVALLDACSIQDVVSVINLNITELQGISS